MNVTVNGSPLSSQTGMTVASLVTEVAPGRAGKGTAVALNGEVVPRGEWDTTRLSDGDRIEVLHAIGGG